MFQALTNKIAPPLKIEKPRQPRHATYTEFVRGIKKQEFDQVIIQPNRGVAVFLDKEGLVGDSQIVPNQEFWRVLTEQDDADVLIDMASPPNTLLDNLNIFFMLTFLFIAIRSFGLFGFGGGSGGGMPSLFPPSEFSIDREVSTRFTDVEGIDQAKSELQEIVDFLKMPEKFAGSGARIPKGAILKGLPGTGKTLLARAIAGESNVPFIDISASSFVEMFVGVGAKRVRDLFELARANQPCIVFIDEIDAIGKRRSANGFSNNDEREQTVNQLLCEMDGFDDTSQIVVLAATNRVDILDEALLRPGRFDRKIDVNLPSIDGRERILQVHVRDKKLDDTVSLEKIAKMTIGFSGADLANMMNECAIRAVRDSEGVITDAIVEDVYQRLVVGAKGDAKMAVSKRELVAYHEAGHAIIGAIHNYDFVRKVSIVPRGEAGGVTFFQPQDDDSGVLQTKDYYIAQLRVALGGRAAEEVVYGPSMVSTGASGDLARVYELARAMVTQFGFGEHYYDYQNLSPETARMIDIEIDELVKKCYDETLMYVTKHRADIELLKNELLAKEIVDGSFVYDLICNL
jgi:cell division protease FtsH